jgi:putative membrane protein
MSAQVRKLGMMMASALMFVGAGVVVADDAGLRPTDRKFLNDAAQGGLMEVTAGKLAAKRAEDPAVRVFGQMMVADHTAANEMLKSLADSKQMPVPDAVSADQRAALGKLEGLNGTDFDKAYADMMVKDHVADVADFEKEVKSAKDPDVKTFAQQTLPTLRHHLMLANQLSSQEKKSPSPPPAP